VCVTISPSARSLAGYAAKLDRISEAPLDARRIEAILLAAGESRRMGYPKPLLRVGAESFIVRTTALALDVASRLVIVLGAHADRVRPAIARDSRITIVENPNYLRGQLSSLKAGLAEATAGGADAVLVHLADHPMVAPATFRALVDAYRRTAKLIVVARCHGRRGHPVIFDRAVFAELMAAPEDQGARVVVNAEAARVAYVDVDDPGVVLDLDTPADLVLAGLPPPPTEG
jgi:molybdenum cofactor cytidylyltransferase